MLKELLDIAESNRYQKDGENKQGWVNINVATKYEDPEVAFAWINEYTPKAKDSVTAVPAANVHVSQQSTPPEIDYDEDISAADDLGF